MAMDIDTKKRFDKLDKQMDNLADAMIKGFSRIEKTLETKADSKDLNRLIGLVDSLAKRIEISEDERLVMAHQLTQLHDWVELAAKRIDVKFAH
jgi:hypothetical protein